MFMNGQSHGSNSAADAGKSALLRMAAAGAGPMIGAFALFALSANSSDMTPAADEGRVDYVTNCASCHGDTLSGAFGPSLRTAGFKARWGSKNPSALRAYIGSTMPPSNAGGLAPDTYDRLTGFIVRATGLTASQSAAATSSTVAPNSTRASAAATSDRALNESGGVGVMESNTDEYYTRIMRDRSNRLAAIRPVSGAMLHQPAEGDWLNYRRSGDGTGFSPLRQINRHNAAQMTLGWSLAIPAGTNAITPLVRGGVMFLNSSGTILALDGATGDLLWKFVRPAEAPPMGPPITQPRSLAMYKDKLIVPTADNHLIALDIRTGGIVWDHLISGMRKGLRITAGPLVVGERIIQGMSGCAGVGEPGGCFIVGLNADTGDEVWRFHTIAKSGDPNGDSWNEAPDDQRYGGSIWTPASFDSETGLIYIGTGQTYHISTLMRPDGKISRKNAGLYTDTTLALDPGTGKLRWFYQHMARDVWDLDWSFERIIATLPIKGRQRHVVMTVGKLGIVDVLDARTGQYIASYDMGLQSLVTRIDPVTGWKTTDPALEPDPLKSKSICPFPTGVRNWPATAYDPTSHILFVPFTKSCMDFTWLKGQDWDITYALRVRPGTDGRQGGIAAIDLSTLKPAWTAEFRAPTASALLTTAGGVLFGGGRDRSFRAFDSSTGKILWSAKLDNVPSATPITYTANGTQFVSITTGGGNPNDAIARTLTPELEPAAHSTTLWVFQLAGKANPALDR